MTIKNQVLLTSVLFVGLIAACTNDVSQTSKVKYEPTWESLRQHTTPEWFKDAKFGIYFHWGAYSVPAFDNEWYPRHMYQKDSKVFEFHRENFGPQSEFGYKDFIPMFKAENFNPDEWAELFKKAGAQFAGPVAEHHDGFAMWDSGLTKWDAADMGPKRDTTGELARAIRKQGMKFVVSFHHGFHWKFFEPSYEGDYDTKDPEYTAVDRIYPPFHEKETPESEEFLNLWEAKIKEVIDKYEPDYMWFDFGWREPTFEEYKKSIIAYYYNKAEELGKEVVVSHKDDHLPPGVAVLDIERGKLDTLTTLDWITDTSVDRKSWCYIKNPDYKSVNTIVDNLVDRVSKNGNLLLNIGPRPDGTIPDEQKKLLLDIGEWLDVNGEAIYGTRYWKIYGEGPTKIKAGSFGEKDIKDYTVQDIRFTTKDSILYAICLDWPEREFNIKSLSSTSNLCTEKIIEITMLGNNEKLKWSRDKDALTIMTPTEKPCEHAFVFKISFQDVL
ncbi:MAG TPA: alpha-L-fucosidase [bacterium]|nr:alpha-L-fucosidase [bacterium]